MSRNRAILLGNIGKIEFRNNQAGGDIITISLATSESWNDKTTGERKEKTEWHRIVVFSQGLTKVIKENPNWIKKGAKVYIEGKIQTRKWTDNNGVDKYTTEIVLEGFDGVFKVITAKKEGQEEAPKAETTQVTDEVEMDDDIPF